MEDKKTLAGISVQTLDKAKIHVVRYKDKYDSVTDLVTIAVESQIESDEHDSNTTTTQ